MNDKFPDPPEPGLPATTCSDYPPVLVDSPLLTDEELAASREATFAHWDGKFDVRIFGYGSLIWNPGLPTVEAVRGKKVHGYHRGLYLWSRVNRGTPKQPRFVLALDRGGSLPAWHSGSQAKPRLHTSKSCGGVKCRWDRTDRLAAVHARRWSPLAFVMRCGASVL